MPSLRSMFSKEMILTGVIGLSASILLTLLLLQNDLVRGQQLFQKETERFAVAVGQRLEGSALLLQDIGSLFVAGKAPEYDVFSRTVQSVASRYPHLIALQYVPIVPRNQRAAFESKMHAHIPKFKFTHRAPAGHLMVARSADLYYPVLYLAPLAQNISLSGYDYYSNPDMRVFLEATSTAGRARIAQFDPFQRADTSLTIAYPLFNETAEQSMLTGWLLGEFSVKDMMVTAGLPVIGAELVVRLDDVTDPDRPVNLYPGRTEGNSAIRNLEEGAPIGLDGYDTIQLFKAFLFKQPVQINQPTLSAFGRTYEVTAWAGYGYFRLHTTLLPLIMLFVSLLLTALIMFVVHTKKYSNQDRQQLLAQGQNTLLLRDGLLQRNNDTDPLTGLANKRHLNEYLLREWRLSLNDGHPIALMQINIENLEAFEASRQGKDKNTGLVSIARLMTEQIQGQSGLAARIVDGVFFVVLPRVSDSHAWAVKIQQALAKLNDGSRLKEPLAVTIAAGSFFAHPDKNYDHMVAKLNGAMAKATPEDRDQILIVTDY